jgi:hypothetical protein
MFKCKICGKKYTELTALYNHIESKHKDMIPKDMSVQQYYYYMKTGRMNGNCVMCKQPTSWNMNTGKYNRFCGDPKCKDEYVKIMKGRMIAKYGKTHLLNDPNKQREMLANRSISGTYTWSDGKHESTYTGSYELDFLKTMDDFFNWDPEDISMPSPHTYTYKYEGEERFYIPDVFIHSLNLEIEIKDGGDNPNNHHKIQDVDKEKERLKDEVLCSQKIFNYVKLTNKNFENFFRFMKKYKQGFEKYGDESKIPRIFEIEDIKGISKPVKESTEVIEENFVNDINKTFKKINNKAFIEYDMFFKIKYDLVKNSPEELKHYISSMIRVAKNEDDLAYVQKLVNDSQGHYYTMMKRRPERKDEYQVYYNWIKDGGMEKEIDKRRKKLKESFEIVEELDTILERMNPEERANKKAEDIFKIYLDALEKYGSLNYAAAINGSGIRSGDIFVQIFTKDGKKIYNKNFDVKHYPNLHHILDEKVKNHHESIKESYVTDIMSESSISMSQMNMYLQNEYEEEMRHYLNTYKKYYNLMLKEQPSAVKHINEDIRKCLIVIDGMADKGVENNLVQFAKDDLGEIVKAAKHGKPVKVIESLEFEPLEENLLFSKNNIELNLDKYNSENNILYITGLGGSGKSTIISEYAKKYDAEALEFDAITSALIRGLENLNRNKIHPIILEYLETQNPNKLNGFNDSNFGVECVKFLDWFEDKVSGDGKFYVIEGMQIFLCFEPERFIGKPMIIMGTSVTKSMYRSTLRVYKRSEGDIKKTFKFFLKTLQRSKLFIKNDKQISHLIDVMNESTNTQELDCKLVYSNPNAKQIFSLMDVDSKLIIENSYIVQRDKVGTHCTVTPYYKDIEENNILEFTVTMNKDLNIEDLKNKCESGVVISNLHKFNDDEFKFIRESCLKLFGVYPEEIKIK